MTVNRSASTVNLVVSTSGGDGFDREALLDDVLKCAAEVFRVELASLSAETSVFEDLGSFGADDEEFATAVEEKFGIWVDEQDLSDLVTLGQWTDLLLREIPVNVFRHRLIEAEVKLRGDVGSWSENPTLTEWEARQAQYRRGDWVEVDVEFTRIVCWYNPFRQATESVHGQALGPSEEIAVVEALRQIRAVGPVDEEALIKHYLDRPLHSVDGRVEWEYGSHFVIGRGRGTQDRGI